jgi:hypothetical protein
MIKEGMVVLFDWKGEVAIGTVTSVSGDKAVIHDAYSPKGGGPIRGRWGGLVRSLSEIKPVDG